MARNDMYKNHPYEERQANRSNAVYNPEMTDYINGVKYHGGINQTILGLSKTQGMDIDKIYGGRR